MQLKVFIDLNSPLILPVNYNHILQGIIYTAANTSNGKFTRKLHDEGVSSDSNDKFKLFCFSKIIGHYLIVENQIHFDKSIFFEIRSVDPYFIHLVYESFSNYGICFKNRVFKPRLKLENKIITDSRIYVQMLSPIVAIGKTDDNQTKYLSPRDLEFISYLCNNFSNRLYRKFKGFANFKHLTDIYKSAIISLCLNITANTLHICFCFRQRLFWLYSFLYRFFTHLF